MGFRDVFGNVDLHDSSILGLTFEQGKSQLVLQVALCNWRQTGFRPGNPDVVQISIVFSGVHSLSFASSKTELLSHDEILEVTVTPVDAGKLHRTRFVLAPSLQSSDVAVLEVVASSVETFSGNAD
jgi:hypothetical protein